MKESPFQSIGSFTLICPGQAVVFGDAPNNDLVVIERSSKFKKTALFENGVEKNYDPKVLIDLSNKIQSLTHADTVCQVGIDNSLLKFIKQGISKWSSTHLRLFTYQEKLRILFFDCRMNVQTHRVLRKKSLITYHMDLDIRFIEDFALTLKAASFVKISQDDYLLRIRSNGIVSFEKIDDEVSYLMRDQRLQEPLISFYNSRIKSDIVFSPAPNL